MTAHSLSVEGRTEGIKYCGSYDAFCNASCPINLPGWYYKNDAGSWIGPWVSEPECEKARKAKATT